MEAQTGEVYPKEMNHKSVRMKRHRFTNAEREYVKGIAHNLSFQRLTDQEIVQWLREEKQIDLDRSTVSRMRNKVERAAEKWYVELRQSTYKYIAIYKERIDSLFSYQKKLHEIIHATKKDEVKIKAISELHSIEMDIFNLWKQLPNLDIADQPKQTQPQEEEDPPIFDIEDINGVEEIPENDKGLWHNWV